MTAIGEAAPTRTSIHTRTQAGLAQDRGLRRHPGPIKPMQPPPGRTAGASRRAHGLSRPLRRPWVPSRRWGLATAGTTAAEWWPAPAPTSSCRPASSAAEESAAAALGQGSARGAGRQALAQARWWRLWPGEASPE